MPANCRFFTGMLWWLPQMMLRQSPRCRSQCILGESRSQPLISLITMTISQEARLAAIPVVLYVVVEASPKVHLWTDESMVLHGADHALVGIVGGVLLLQYEITFPFHERPSSILLSMLNACKGESTA